jgi:hypothetical protein
MRTQKLLLLALGCAWAMAASAQWQWLDKDGRKVFSDRPPPQDVPEKNILKQPPGRASSRTPAAPAATGAAPAGDQPAAVAAASPRPAASAPKLSTVDKELEEKKKQADEAEAAKQKAEEQKLAKARAENCNRAKTAKSTIDSGVRVGRVNAKGEQEILDDAARASEAKRLQGIIDSDCK